MGVRGHVLGSDDWVESFHLCGWEQWEQWRVMGFRDVFGSIGILVGNMDLSWVIRNL